MKTVFITLGPGTLANSEDTDSAFHQGLDYLL